MPISISIPQPVTCFLVMIGMACALLRKPSSVGKLMPRAPRGDQDQRWNWGRIRWGGQKGRMSTRMGRDCVPQSPKKKGWQGWRMEPRAWLRSYLAGQVHASALWPDETGCAWTRLGPVSWGNRDQPRGHWGQRCPPPLAHSLLTIEQPKQINPGANPP